MTNATGSPPHVVPNSDVAIRRYGRLGRDWVAGVGIADPVADAVVADFSTLPPGEGMQMFRAAIEHGIDTVADAPASLRTFFAAVDTEPDWLDHDRLDRAAGHLVRHMASYGIVLGAASLTAGAMNSTAGMPLVMTGRYTSQAAVRSLEVGSWMETILTPGGLRRDGAGFATTLRVRMIHAFVRSHLWGSGQWDDAAWGAPIPQSFMAFTIAEFGHVALAAMHQLGVRYTADELDDIYHLWRYVSLLNGVGPELNPATEADHIRIEELYALTATDPDDGDRDFVRALTHDYLAVEIAALLPIGGRHAHGFAVSLVNGLTRAFLGDEAAAKLGVPDTALKHLPTVLSPVLGSLNRALAAVPGLTALRTRRALAGHATVMTEQRRRYGMTHDLVDTAPDSGKHPAAL
jgi:ER-bound oxygenase mpaB/B'/Rubber oxygenase, catalytic domain